MDNELSEIRNDFPIVQNQIYVNHAAVGPIPRSVAAAMQNQIDIQLYSIGEAWERAEEVKETGRRLAAKLVNGRPEHIAWIQNTSHGISLIANGIDWRPGDNVLVPDLEFPSNYFVWKNLASLGVELRHIPSVDHQILPGTIERLIDTRTRVVTLSHVQYYNGFRCDIPAIGEICRRKGALLVVDGTQSIGAIQLDVTAARVDALVVSSHKWMLGPLGIGFMALSEQAMREVAVSVQGWLSFTDPFNFARDKTLLPDAGRFEPGTENSVGIYGLTARLEALDRHDPAQVEVRVIRLTDRLCAGLSKGGCHITSHRGPGQKSGIVTFTHPTLAADLLLKRLTAANIVVSLRSGAIRVSPHYYNSDEEIDRFIDVVTGYG